MNIEQNLKSVSYYSSITGVKLIPKTIVKPNKKLIYKKGDFISGKKRWFKRNVEIKYAETDLYDGSWYDRDGSKHKNLLTPAQCALSEDLHYDEEKNEFYKKPIVKIEFVSSSAEKKLFDTDEEALLFVNELKLKCAKCNNELL
jgi:hypothetical protein